jgi:hypothetical protein
MSTKRTIIKDICEGDGLNKHQTKEVLQGGVLVVKEAYSGPRKNHFEVNPADGGPKRPRHFGKVFRGGKWVKSR